ncbi:MAG TPA: DUF3108 domain-containing protein [Pseudobdellovibrionaceae bacterium]|nr:DUF3108 domain-containing protein [Pseudobdellovibrionaceae bacterium]
MKYIFLFLILGTGVFSCTSKVLKHDPQVILEPNKEFDQFVKIETTEATEPTDTSESTKPTVDSKPVDLPKPLVEVPEKVKVKTKTKSKSKLMLEPKQKAPTSAEKKPKVTLPERRPPELEDTEGFDGRRPLVDPFYIGEEVTLRVHYFAMTAGEIKFKIKNFAQVNGQKAYSMVAELKTSSFFSHVYTVDDYVENFMDYFNLTPIAYSLHVKESGQIREAKSFFDFKKNEAQFWEKKITEEHGVEERKLNWDILPYSQNVFSTFYYLRLFKWTVGNEYSFRVAHDNENLVFKAKALRKEVIDTDLGPKNTIVIQPQILLKGIFKPVGDVFIWLSDDEKKYILKLESKIKIGTIKADVISIKPGVKP